MPDFEHQSGDEVRRLASRGVQGVIGVLDDCSADLQAFRRPLKGTEVPVKLELNERELRTP